MFVQLLRKCVNCQ